MKKALVLALTVLMVLSLAGAAFAANVTYEGKVELKWGGGTDADPQFKDAKKEAKIKLDYTKDYGDGVTAGVKTKIENDADKVAFDGEGWVKLERDLFALQASTGIDGGAGKNLKEFNITKAPGLGLDLKLIDGLTVNTIVNAGSDYNFLVKGEFAQDLFTLGGGFGSFYADDDEDLLTEDVKRSTLGFYGTLNLIDGLVVNAEFGRRDLNTETEKDEYTAIFATAAYDLDALSTKAGFLMQDKGFEASVSKDDVSDEGWRINETIRSTKFNDDFADWDAQFAKFFGASDKVMVIFGDASYKLTDALEVNGYVDYLLSAKDADDKDVDDIEKLSYKAGVAYTLDALKLEGWYKAYGKSQFGGKATYTLVEGVDTSFEVTYGNDVKDGDNKVSYTAAIAATL